jgi:hypothetical protein
MTPERQKLLSALADVTPGLSGLRDFDDAVAALVSGARTIFGSDIAYVSLNDDSTETTSIRGTLGVTTEAYRRMSTGYGEGLLGRVAVSDRPLQIADVIDGPRVESPGGIRVAVEDEGVRAVLGAPLGASGRRIGGLFIADRTPHGFSPDVVSTLESLASHGAVVLTNALAVGDLARSLEEAQSAREAASLRLGEVRMIRAADERFLSAIAERPDPSLFELTVREVIREQTYVVLLDPRRGTVDQTPLPAPISGLDSLLRAGGGLAAAVSSGSQQLRLAPARAGDRLLGAVVLYGPATALDESMLESAAGALGVLLGFRQALAETKAGEHSELLSRLVSGVPLSDRSVVRHELNRLGLRADEPLALALVSPVVGPAAATLRTLRSTLKGPMLSSLHGGHVCLIVNTDDIDLFAERCARELAGRGSNATVAVESIGLLGDADLFDVIPQAHVLAERVTRVATSLGRAGEAVTRASLGAVALVIADDDSLSRDLARHAIAPLVAYDAEHGTDLVATAAAVLDASQRITIAAAVLHVHENTVRQRMTRIDQLLGPGWRDGGSSLDFHLALRLHQLTRSRCHTI